jgi:hypothetical protein
MGYLPAPEKWDLEIINLEILYAGAKALDRPGDLVAHSHGQPIACLRPARE